MGEADEVAHGKGAAGIEVDGVSHFEDDDLEVGGGADEADLVEEDVGGAEEEFAFDVDDGDFGDFAGFFDVLFGEFAFFIEGVLHEAWFADFSKEEDDGGDGAEADGHVEGEEESA